MSPEEIAKFKSDVVGAIAASVPEAIDKAVNGGIRAMRKQLDDHLIAFEQHTKDDSTHNKIVDEHLAADAVWKEKDAQYKENIKPVIQAGQNALGWGKTTVYFTTFLASIGTVVLGAFEIIKRLK